MGQADAVTRNDASGDSGPPKQAGGADGARRQRVAPLKCPGSSWKPEASTSAENGRSALGERNGRSTLVGGWLVGRPSWRLGPGVRIWTGPGLQDLLGELLAAFVDHVLVPFIVRDKLLVDEENAELL